MAPSAERRFGDLLDALAERSPAPGAGSAAAWAGALAAALLEMTAAFAGREDVSERGALLRRRLLDAGEAELESYAPVLAAARLDSSDPSRTARLQEALSQASEAPVAIAEAATEVAELAAEVAVRSRHGLEGDACTGVVLAEAATESACRLVEINLRDGGEDPRLDRARQLRERARAARAHALTR